MTRETLPSSDAESDGDIERNRTTDETDGPTGTSTRRRFLGGVGGSVATTVFGLDVGSERATADATAGRCDADREERARQVRMELVRELRDEGIPPMSERATADDGGSPPTASRFTKGLPHSETGCCDREAYDQLVEALETGDPDLFDSLPMAGHRQLIEPRGAYGFELMGPDPHSFLLAAPPEFNSDRHLGELVELYWQSLARDIPFSDYPDDELVRSAAAELADTPGYDGPTDPRYLFHADLPGVESGPYLSQFLWKDAPLSVHEIDQRILTLEPGVDYVTDHDEWLANMRGRLPRPDRREAESLTDHRKYMSTGRDLAACVERDVVFQPYFIALMTLIGRPVDGVVDDPRETYGSYHPYADSDTQAGFLNFGREGALDLVSGIGQPAHAAAWFQKWVIHRRARPEKYAGLVEATANEGIDADHAVPIERLEEYEAFDRVHDEFGSHLLTQAYPEGAPLHPAYPGGHSTVSGACVTVLKAVLNEDRIIDDPVRAKPDGSSLEPWNGEALTVGDELNKLASNVNMGGRQFAGVHYRSDHEAGLRLGEELAIGYLEDESMRLREDFGGWTFTSFDGERVTID